MCQLEKLAGRAQKELVLLHPKSTKMPSRTAEWLNIRTWCTTHHHIRCDEEILPLSSKDAENVFSSGDGRPIPHVPPKEETLELSHFGRLARHLRGISVGLVLGGGGARGAAHLGVIRAMEEEGKGD